MQKILKEHVLRLVRGWLFEAVIPRFHLVKEIKEKNEKYKKYRVKEMKNFIRFARKLLKTLCS